MKDNGQVIQIPIEDIIPNRFQPRISFDQKALEDLAKSIKQHGIIQPLVVRKLGEKYEIIAGERRYKASQLAGLVSVPAIVSEYNDQESAEIALVENVQREDLSAIEEARSYKNILDSSQMTQDDLAKKMGLSQSSVSNKLRLLNLTDDVQKAVLDGKISERHARSLLQLEDPNMQNELLNRVIDERLTVRQLDTIIKDIKNPVNDDEMEDVPLVDINENLEKMKNEATDIVSSSSRPTTVYTPPVAPINNSVPGSVNIPEPSNQTFNPSDNKKGNRFFNFDFANQETVTNTLNNPPKPATPEQSFFDFVSNSSSNDSSNLANEEITTPTTFQDDLLKNIDYNAPVVSDGMVEEMLDVDTPTDTIETLDDSTDTLIFEGPSTSNDTMNTKINRIKDFVKGLDIDNEIDVSEKDLGNIYQITININKDIN